jgi:hypothetical protein
VDRKQSVWKALHLTRSSNWIMQVGYGIQNMGQNVLEAELYFENILILTK